MKFYFENKSDKGERFKTIAAIVEGHDFTGARAIVYGKSSP